MCQAPHLNAVWLLVEQTLGCCRRKERDSISAWEFTESWAWGYTNMQQAYQSTVLIFKLQVQNPTAKSIMQCNRCLGWHHHLCNVAPLLHTNSPVKCWGLKDVLAGDERDKVPKSRKDSRSIQVTFAHVHMHLNHYIHTSTSTTRSTLYLWS